MVMKLNKCLNGLVKYPLYWYNNLKGAFEEKGFKPILLDTCMFHGRGMNALIYVDDELLFVLDQDKIGEFIKELENYSLLLTVEEYVYALFGVEVETVKQSGKVTLNQGGLNKKLLKIVGMLYSNTEITLESTMALGTDDDGPTLDETWEYASVAVMMMYLSKNSRPDIHF